MANDPAPAPVLVPLPQSKERYGFGRNTAYRLAAQGKLTLKKVGVRTYIDHASALAMIEAAPTVKPAA